MEALYAKAHGIRINAAKVLAAWGDKESIDALRSLLVEYSAKPKGHYTSDLATIINLITPHVEKLDREWAIELYFSPETVESEFHLRQLLYAFPLKATASALAGRYRSGKNVDRIPALLDLMQFYAFVRKRKD